MPRSFYNQNQAKVTGCTRDSGEVRCSLPSHPRPHDSLLPSMAFCTLCLSKPSSPCTGWPLATRAFLPYKLWRCCLCPNKPSVMQNKIHYSLILAKILLLIVRVKTFKTLFLHTDPSIINTFLNFLHFLQKFYYSLMF